MNIFATMAKNWKRARRGFVYALCVALIIAIIYFLWGYFQPISRIKWTDTNKQVASALIGSLLGAVVGAIATYLTSEHARKAQREQDEIDKLRADIKLSAGAAASIEDNLHRLLVICLKNTGHFRDMKKGIYDSAGRNTVFTLSLPKPYSVTPKLSNNLFNADTVIQWEALELEIMLHNSNITEITDYYSMLRSEIRKVQMTSPSSLNVAPIEHDSGVIASAATGQLAACENFKERCFQVLARLQLYVKINKTIDYKTVTLDELKAYKLSLVNYKPTPKKLENALIKLRETYTEEKAFQVNETLVS